jgi:hypothetical protein
MPFGATEFADNHFTLPLSVPLGLDLLENQDQGVLFEQRLNVQKRNK